MPKYRYLLHSARKALLRQGLNCPSCGGIGGKALDQKYLVTSLRRCLNCSLLYRTPTMSLDESAYFYENDYEEGSITDLPSDAQLEELKKNGFARPGLSYARYIDVILALGAKPGQRLMDFGCSWGYGSLQLKKMGFMVKAYEISRTRSLYARDKLGVETIELENIGSNAFDVFFSAHVIEHVHSVVDMLALGDRALRPGGLFVAFTPNGSLAYRHCNPDGWHRSWGKVHPQLIDDVFLRRTCIDRSFLVASEVYPMAALKNWSGGEAIYPLDGYELMFAFRKTLPSI